MFRIRATAAVVRLFPFLRSFAGSAGRRRRLTTKGCTGNTPRNPLCSGRFARRLQATSTVRHSQRHGEQRTETGDLFQPCQGTPHVASQDASVTVTTVAASDAVSVWAQRTPTGRYGGSRRDVHPVEVGADASRCYSW